MNVRRENLMLIAVLAMLAGAASPAIATDWVLDRDFSATTNPSGAWTYGFFIKDASGSSWFVWKKAFDWPDRQEQIKYWGSPGGNLDCGCVFYTAADKPLNVGTQWWAPHKVMLHPARLAGTCAPVIRWTAPSDMQVSVSAIFYGCQEVTTDVHILLNGRMNDSSSYTGSLMDALIDGNYGYEPLGIAATNPQTNHAGYQGVLNLMAGDKLDFVVGPNGWYGHDLTGLDVTITKLADIPAPSDWVLDRDFTKGSNPHGNWTYGVYLDDANPDTWYTWSSYYDWPGLIGSIGCWGNANADLRAGCTFYNGSDNPVKGGNSTQWFPPHKVMLHPALYSDFYAPVVRWTAPAAMSICVEALFYGCEETTTDVHILLNGDMHDGAVYTGTHLLDGLIDGNYGCPPLDIPATKPETNHVAYQGVLDVAAGDTLDFVVNANGWFGFDLTGLDVTITPLCDPCTRFLEYWIGSSIPSTGCP